MLKEVSSGGGGMLSVTEGSPGEASEIHEKKGAAAINLKLRHARITYRA